MESWWNECGSAPTSRGDAGDGQGALYSRARCVRCRKRCWTRSWMGGGLGTPPEWFVVMSTEEMKMENMSLQVKKRVRTKRQRVLGVCTSSRPLDARSAALLPWEDPANIPCRRQEHAGFALQERWRALHPPFNKKRATWPSTSKSASARISPTGRRFWNLQCTNTYYLSHVYVGV